MTQWPVFLTAPRVDPKALNKAWILLQDFEYTDPDCDSAWVLFTSKKLPETPPKSSRLLTTAGPILDHDFANANLNDLSSFIRANEAQLKHLKITPYMWILIDQEGLDSFTCVLVHRRYDAEAKKKSQEFEAVRIPFTEAWSIFANLDIANMSFDEFAKTDAGLQDDGTYKWVGPFSLTNEAQIRAKEETETQRDACLKVARNLGHID